MDDYMTVVQDHNARLKVAIEHFCFENREVLSEFQLEVCEKILDPDADQDDLRVAITMIHQKIDILVKACWRPAKQTTGDMVNQPSHYARIPTEPTFFNMEYGIDWCTGNVLKYVCRFPFKNGIEDLRKAQRYLAMKIRWLEGDKEWSK